MTQDRTVVVPAAFISTLGERLLRTFGPNAAEDILYDIGRVAGRDFTRVAEGQFGRPLRTAEDFDALLQMVGRDYRWAEITLREIDVPGKSAVLEWRDGVGVPHGGSPRPVCHLGRGLLAGAAEVLFGTTCDAIETQCQGMGAAHCEIVVGTPNHAGTVSEGIVRPSERR